MKIKYKVKIGDYTIVGCVADASVDGQATKEKIKPLITPEMTEVDVEHLFNENKVYAKIGQEGDFISDEEGELLQKKIDEKGEHRVVSYDSYEYIANYLGTEFWLKKSNKWKKEQIGEVGKTLPFGAVLPKDLSEKQQEEIAAQQEKEWIAAMSPEDRAKAKQGALDALADEADRQARRAEIQKRAFDLSAWYSERAIVIEAKYA